MADMRSRFELNGTMVANEFIDRYMAAANGEYVKVYLYLVRHQDRDVTVAEAADALNHTEADIKRAMAYWTRLGVLVQSEADGQGEETAQRARIQRENAQREMAPARMDIGDSGTGRYVREAADGEEITAEPIPVDGASQMPAPQVPKQRTYYTPEQVGRLAKEEEFTQLLYISQKYMNKVFTPRECEVFAYLYDALHMPVELLEYLVEYCVQGEHYSIRYLETVALNWHERGIKTVEMARQHTASFSRDAFAVMKAFGLNERRPGDSEMETIKRWFQEWGFSRELVLEACARTLKSTHKPSFSYADKILSEWKKAGVRTLSDVKQLDERRDSRKTPGNSSPAPRPAKNQFHNFEQRNTDYDGMVLEKLKQRLGEQ